MKYKLQTELGFGKFKGQTISEVLAAEPGYIRWALDSIDWFDVEDDVSEALAEAEAEEALSSGLSPRFARGRF